MKQSIQPFSLPAFYLYPPFFLLFLFSPDHADKDAGVTDQNDVVKDSVWEEASYKDGWLYLLNRKDMQMWTMHKIVDHERARDVGGH